MTRVATRRWSRPLRRGLLTIMVMAAVMLVAVGSYVGYVAVRHARPLVLPPPTGTHPVGRVALDWTDTHRTDPLAPGPGVPRELSVWLWYPAASGSQGRVAPYAPGPWAGLHFGGPAGWAETAFAAVRTHSIVGAPVADGRFPLVVLEPGLGLAALQFTSIAESLASHGYLVLGVTPTYSANVTVLQGRAVHSTQAGNPSHFTTVDGNRLITIWAADARFAAHHAAALDRSGPFASHVDTTRTVYVGHSFGGASAIQACATDSRCAGAVDLDGTPYGPVVHQGTDKPLMIMASGTFCVTGNCVPSTSTERGIRDAAQSLRAHSTGPIWCYGIHGAQHFNFTDYAVYYLAAPVRKIVPLGSIDGRRGLMITNTSLTAFLDKVDRGTHPQLPPPEASRFPDVRELCAPR